MIPAMIDQTNAINTCIFHIFTYWYRIRFICLFICFCNRKIIPIGGIHFIRNNISIFIKTNFTSIIQYSGRIHFPLSTILMIQTIKTFFTLHKNKTIFIFSGNLSLFIPEPIIPFMMKNIPIFMYFIFHTIYTTIRSHQISIIIIQMIFLSILKQAFHKLSIFITTNRICLFFICLYHKHMIFQSFFISIHKRMVNCRIADFFFRIRFIYNGCKWIIFRIHILRKKEARYQQQKNNQYFHPAFQMFFLLVFKLFHHNYDTFFFSS